MQVLLSSNINHEYRCQRQPTVSLRLTHHANKEI
jgi:hypothetical protein